MRLSLFSLFTLLPSLSFSNPTSRATVLYPHDIQGPGFLSPYSGQKISNLQGIVTAITSSGYYLQTPNSKFDSDDKTSEGIYVYGSLPTSSNVSVNDLISISSATVSEYAQYSTNLKTTELTKTTGISIVTKNYNSGDSGPLVLSSNGRHPPTEFVAVENPFALPSNTTNVENQRAKSLNLTFGIDFWESLESMLVTIPAPRALFRPNNYGEVYVVSRTLPSTSGNARGGMTYAAQEINGGTYWDSNPEFILVGAPLNGDSNPSTILMGDTLSDITGIVSYDFGAPVLYPLQKIHVVRKAVGDVPATNLTGDGTCGNFLLGTYNVENLPASDTDRISKLGSQVDSYLNNPSVMVLNEVQDNDGSTDDGVVSANQTLSEFVSAIQNAPYDYVDIDPMNDQDGGQPGGNIRTSIIYRTDHLTLVDSIPAGDDNEAVGVTSDSNGNAQLTLNPGRIDPSNSAWKSSRKPLVIQFTLNNGGQTLFVIGAHFTAKLGSSELYGPSQAPSNGGVDQRIQQAKVVRNFVDQILQVQSDAKIVLLGDFNEFSGVQPLVELTSPNQSGEDPVLEEIEVAVREERYSYVFEGNSQDIDHFFTTPALAPSAKTEIVHVNNWGSLADAASDHDPLVGSLSFC